MPWILAFHIIFVICWFAGIFYLPRLFVYHAMATDTISIERFKIMERKLFYGIMTPSAILAIVFGSWLILLNYQFYLHSGWMIAKLILVALLIVFHIYCGRQMRLFKRNNNTHSHVFFRFLNEFPVLLLVGIVIFVVVKPF